MVLSYPIAFPIDNIKLSHATNLYVISRIAQMRKYVCSYPSVGLICKIMYFFIKTFLLW